MKKIIFLGFGLISFILLPLSTAHACTCAEPTVPEAFNQATAVFVGKPITYEHVDPTPQSEPIDLTKTPAFQISTSTFTFEISKKWKGDISRVVTVQTTFDRRFVSCNIDYFDHEKEYLVYATGDLEHLKANEICLKTKPESMARSDMKELDRLAKPTEYDSFYETKVFPRLVTETSPQNLPWFIAKLVLLGILLLSVLIGVVVMIIAKIVMKKAK